MHALNPFSTRVQKRTRAAEETKTNKYKLLCQQRGMDFVPIVFTTSGGMGEQLQRRHWNEIGSLCQLLPEVPTQRQSRRGRTRRTCRPRRCRCAEIVTNLYLPCAICCHPLRCRERPSLPQIRRQRRCQRKQRTWSFTTVRGSVLALKLIDMLRSHAERLAVLPHAHGLARKQPKERIREQAHEKVERRGALLDG